MMQTKENLMRRMKEETRVFENSAVEAAFRAIDRADFLREDYAVEAYEDYPLPISDEQTISQPTTVAFMLEKLDVEKGDTVLDVGSGSGYTTALLAHMTGEEGRVIGVELLPELVEMGRENLKKCDFKHAEIFQAGKRVGKEELAPFDKILVSAAAESESEMIDDLLDQLTEGGRMVIPIDEAIVVFKKDNTGKIQSEQFEGFVFVPLMGTASSD